MILLKNLCDYDYDYDYSKMCNRLQSITIIIVIRPNPGLCHGQMDFCYQSAGKFEGSPEIHKSI